MRPLNYEAGPGLGDCGSEGLSEIDGGRKSGPASTTLNTAEGRNVPLNDM